MENLILDHEEDYILSFERNVNKFLMKKDKGTAKIVSQSPALSDERFLKIIRGKKFYGDKSCEYAVKPEKMNEGMTGNIKFTKAIWLTKNRDS